MTELQPESVKCSLSDGKLTLTWRFNPAVFTFGLSRNTVVQYPLNGDSSFVYQTGIVQTLSIPMDYPDFSKEIETALKTLSIWVRSDSSLKLVYGQHQYPHVILKGFTASITRYENGAARTGSIGLELIVTSEKGKTPTFKKEDTKNPPVKTPRELAKTILKPKT